MAAGLTVEQMTHQNAQAIQQIAGAVNALTKKLQNTPAQNQPAPEHVLQGHAPRVRQGENIMGSRGFSFMKMFGVLTGAMDVDQAKVEIDIHRKMHQAFSRDPENGYTYRGGRRPGETAFLAPIATGFMPETNISAEFRQEMKSLVSAGVGGADPDHMNWIRRKAYGYDHKTLSWINELTGGALVQPPEQGEIIELLRSKEAAVQAGARVVPLPAQGRMKYPRQTAASLTYWVGENMQITSSDIGTGEINLQAKKLAVLIKAPNELIRFASPAAESLMRDDMTKSLALGLDQACFEGAGGDNRPRGLLNYPDVYRLTSSDPRDNGDRLVAEDAYRMIVAVEEANAEFEGFVMRPMTWYKYYQMRADAVAQGDKSGMFLFSMIRDVGDGLSKPSLAGYPVTKSTLISKVRQKGASSALTYIAAGMWSEMLIGMFGAVEFASTNLGDTPFQFDQTWVRGLLSADVALRHEAAFVVLDQLNLAI